MKKMMVTLVIGLSIPFYLAAQTSNDVFFRLPNNKAVIEKAKAEDKIIFYDFMATWCGPCKEMDAYVYSDSSVKSVLKDKFLSVKVQMDQTKSDANEIKSWYPDAIDLGRKYQVTAYPTYVFISPEGKLVDMGFGYLAPEQFLKLLTRAGNPQSFYYKLVERFNNNMLPTKEMLALAIRAKEYKDSSFAQTIVWKYKSAYFDRQTLDSQLNHNFTDLAFHFPNTIKETDSVVQYLYKHPNILDSAFRPNISNEYLSYFVARDFITPIVFEAEKANKEPDWRAIEKQLSKKYDVKTAKSITEGSQLGWYYKKQDWDKVIKIQIGKIEENGIANAARTRAFDINNLVFDLIFKKTDNPVYLKKGLELMEAVLAEQPDDHSSIDTYANVLYKLGRKKEAIAQETRALQIAKEKNSVRDTKEFETALFLMRNNQPTWK